MLNMRSLLQIPVLLTITATGIALAYYLFNKMRNNPEESTSKTRYILIQLKIPKQYVGIIVGKGGAMIKEIQAQTGAVIKIRDIANMEDPNCICDIKGNAEGAYLAEAIIKKIINNHDVIKKSKSQESQ